VVQLCQQHLTQHGTSHLTQAPQAVDRANPEGSPHAPYHDQTAGALLGAAAGLWDERGGDRIPPQRSSSIMAIMLSVGCIHLRLDTNFLHFNYPERQADSSYRQALIAACQL
jgi:hypothetical protein